MLGEEIRRNSATVSKEERDHFRDAIAKLHTLPQFHYRRSVARGPETRRNRSGSIASLTVPAHDPQKKELSPGPSPWAARRQFCCATKSPGV